MDLKGLKILGCFLLFAINSGYSQTINFTVTGDKACAPLTVVANNNNSSSGVDYFEIDWGDGTVLTLPADSQYTSHTHYYDENAVGIYIVELREYLSVGAVARSTIPIVIYNRDLALFTTGAQTVCDGDLAFDNTSNLYQTPGGRTVVWDFGDGTVVTTDTSDVTHTYDFSQDSTYQVVMTQTNMCGTDTAVGNVNIVALNTSLAIYPSSPVCKHQLVDFSNVDVNTNATNITYSWDFGDGQTSTATYPQHEYNAEGSYTATLIVQIPGGQQCADTATTVVDVLPGPDARFTINYTPACDELIGVTFSNTTGGSHDTYNWALGNGSTSTDFSPAGSYNYDSAGYYYVKLIVGFSVNGCTDTTVDTLLVPSSPVVNFTAQSVCIGKTARFTDLSINAYGAISSWNWDFGDGTTSTQQNPQKIYNTADTMLVHLQVWAGICSSDTTKALPIEPIPIVNFTANPANGCPPLVVSVQNNTTGAYSYSWQMGDGQNDTLQNPVHTYNNSGTSNVVYSMTLVAATQFGCVDSLSQNITVYPSPNADFTGAIPTLPSCGPVTLNLTSLATGASSILWNFGDGQTSGDSLVAHVYTNPNYYFNHFNISLIAYTSDGCTDTSEAQYLTLYPRPFTSFNVDGNHCSPSNLTFTAFQEQDALYTWDFGDGTSQSSSLNTASHVYTNAGTGTLNVDVELKIRSEFGCNDSTTQTIPIYPLPVPSFTFSPSNPNLYPATITFTNTSTNNAGSGYFWNFGETTDSIAVYAPPAYTYSGWGLYNVELRIVDQYGCVGIVTDTVEIIAPPPFVGFAIDTSAGCPPLTVNFTNTSINVDTNTFVWFFGDGDYRNETNTSHTYYMSGSYTVTLQAVDYFGNVQTSDTIIDVWVMPSAAFNFTPAEIVIPDQPVTCMPIFPNSSYSYLWNFGDDSTSTLMNPVHYYADTGSFTISLIVTTTQGCADTMQLIGNGVAAVAGGTLRYPNGFTPAMSGGSGGRIEPGSGNNEVFYPYSEGVTDYHLEVYSRWGELLFSTNEKEVGWDGYYQGKLCKQDVYVWVVKGKYSTGQSFTKKGTVTLFHTNK